MNEVARPFLKWAGGKRWLIPHIEHLLPKKFNRYFEAFLGSGSLYFHLQPKNAILTDSNEKLINTYKALQERPEKVIRELSLMSYSEDKYYLVRDRLNKNGSNNSTRNAADFIYLNRTCWNGLYRENFMGKFNVPFGRYNNPLICDKDNLLAVSSVTARAKFIVSDFKDILLKAHKGDFVFLDPPYITGHQNNGFHAYNEKLFKWEDQEKLATMAERLLKRGCYVIVTNAHNKEIAKLYEHFNCSLVSRKSIIAGDVQNRGDVSEAVFYPKRVRKYAWH